MTTREQLSDFADVSALPLVSLNLPTDHVRVPGQNQIVASVPLDLETRTLAALSARMSRESDGLGTALLACWMILIRRLTDEQDVAIDFLPAERNRMVVHLHGADRFVPEPSVFAGSSITVSDLLRRVERVVQDSAATPQATDANPGGQVLFVWQKDMAAARDTGTDVDMPQEVGACELAVSFRTQAGRTSGSLLYSAELFGRETATRFAENFRVLAGAIAAAETEQISDLPILGAAERSLILDEWSGQDVPFPADKCIHQLFEEHVRRTPWATALVQGGTKLTYDDLNKQANRLAHRLMKLGLRPDARVAICLHRSFEVIVAQLAVMKAGGAYVPLDPRHPANRLQAMIADSDPVAIITRGEMASLLGTDDSCGPVLLNVQAPNWLDEPDTDIAPRQSKCAPENLAYVIYTSGSTGSPKGVLVEHRGLTNLIVSQMKDFEIDASSRVLQYASFSFDASVTEIYSTLCAGAALVLALPEEILVGEVLAKVLLEHQISHVTFPPPVLATLSTETEFPALRVLIVAGDALPKSLVAHWSKRRQFINAYGPTEATVVATVNLAITEHTANPSIGRPMDNSRIYILDRNLQPVPIGLPGEIYIGGVGVAKGYLNRPDLTAERFVKDPFTNKPGGRMYKSGDLARWWPDGSIEYLGRNDFQLKIRGMRVEPGEIEAALRSVHPGMKECAVLAREIGGQMHLVAYYVLSRGAQPLARETMRDMLAGHLPAHMVPSQFVAIDRMPLTSNGKLDRDALPAAVLRGASDREPPVGAAESAICKAFSKYTGALRVGRNDDFFSLGGSSLGAVLCVDRLNREFARPITLREFVEDPTPRTLALKASAAGESRQFEVGSIVPSGPTICLLPGVGGDEPRLAQFRIRCETFSRIVPIEYPDWSSLIKNRDGDKDGLEYLMDRAVRQIDAHCGDQPVRLIGYSFGGLCAHAVALHLTEMGRRVEFVAFLDTDARLAPTTVQAAQTQFAGGLHYLAEFFLDIGRTLGAIPRKEFTAVFSLSLVRFLTSPAGRWVLPLLARSRHRRLPIRFGYFLHRYLNEALQVWTLESWRRAIVKKPKPLAVPAYLFRSEAHAPEDPVDLGWRTHFPALQVISSKGAHNTMLDPPNLDKLCDEVELAVGAATKVAEKLAI